MSNTFSYVPVYHLEPNMPPEATNPLLGSKDIRIIAVNYSRDGILQHINVLDCATMQMHQLTVRQFCTRVLRWTKDGKLNPEMREKFVLPRALLVDGQVKEDITHCLSLPDGTYALIDYKGNIIKVTKDKLEELRASHKVTLHTDTKVTGMAMPYFREDICQTNAQAYALLAQADMPEKIPLDEVEDYIDHNGVLNAPHYVDSFLCPTVEELSIWLEEDIDSSDYEEELESYIDCHLDTIRRYANAIKFPKFCCSFAYTMNGAGNIRHTSLPFVGDYMWLAILNSPEKYLEFTMPLNPSPSSSIQLHRCTNLEELVIKVFRSNILIAHLPSSNKIKLYIDPDQNGQCKLPKVRLIDLTGHTDTYIDVQRLAVKERGNSVAIEINIPICT